MKVGTHTTLRWSTKDRRLMTELMNFWNRTDKEIMRLAFDQLVLATQQIQQRMNEENSNEKINSDDSIWAGTAGPVESYRERGLDGDDDGREVAEGLSDGAVSADRPADGADET